MDEAEYEGTLSRVGFSLDSKCSTYLLVLIRVLQKSCLIGLLGLAKDFNALGKVVVSIGATKEKTCHDRGEFNTTWWKPVTYILPALVFLGRI